MNSKMKSLRGTSLIIPRHTYVPRHGGWEPLLYWSVKSVVAEFGISYPYLLNKIRRDSAYSFVRKKKLNA